MNKTKTKTKQKQKKQKQYKNTNKTIGDGHCRKWFILRLYQEDNCQHTCKPNIVEHALKYMSIMYVITLISVINWSEIFTYRAHTSWKRFSNVVDNTLYFVIGLFDSFSSNQWLLSSIVSVCRKQTFYTLLIYILMHVLQCYKGKVKTHKYINRQNQSTTGKLWKP
jgi:hypothetical protein